MAFPRSLSLRWLEVITNFNFTVENRKAEDHKDVDFLSRHFRPPNNSSKSSNKREEDEDDEDEETNALIIHQINGGNINEDVL